MQRIIFLLLFSTIFLFGQGEREPSVYTDIPRGPSVYIETPATEILFSNLDEPVFEQPITQSSIFLSVQNQPLKLFKNQIFEVKIRALIALDFEEILFEFENVDEIKLLNPKSSWKKIDQNHYENSFFFKALQNTNLLPTLYLSIAKHGVVLDSAALSLEPLHVISLNANNIFSGVLAKELEVTRFKTTRFDNNSLITVMEISASEANLEDFELKHSLKSGIELIDNPLPNGTMVGFAIFDNSQNELSFTYFNLVKNSFERVILPVVLEESEVSTQTGLNPNESTFNRYNELLLLAVGVLFIIIAILRKNYFYLVITVLSFGYVAYLNLSFSSVMIEQNSRVRIVPTERSTIFFTVEEPTRVEKIGSSEEFIKILFNDGRIGWVRKNNVIKD